jgi:hypothetical protein
MQVEDVEFEQFLRELNCAALLEGWSPSGVWTGGKHAPCPHIIACEIVTHDGRGW